MLLAVVAAASGAPGGASSVGTAGPADVAAVAADGSWVVLCQARIDTDGDGRLAVRTHIPGGTSGDAQHAYLVVGTGAGTTLEDLVAADPAGERLVVRRRGRLVLLEPARAGELDLTALGATSVRFADDGQRLLYVKPVGRRVHIIVRALALGRETDLDPGPGTLASVDIEGDWIRAGMIPPGAAWNVHEDHRPQRCWTGMLSDVVSSSGTAPVPRWIPASGGKAREAPDLVGVVGATLLRRTGDGALVTEDSHGITNTLVPVACGARVVSIDANVGSVVVACHDGQLFEYGAGKPRQLGATIAVPAGDRMRETGRFLLARGKADGSLIVDLRTGAQRETGADQQVIAWRGDLTVLQRGLELVVVDHDHERVIGAIAQYPATRRSGPFVYVEPLVVDLATGALVGVAPSREVPYLKTTTGWLTRAVRANVKAIANDGRLLAGFGGGTFELTPGPLEWIVPDKPGSP